MYYVHICMLKKHPMIAYPYNFIQFVVQNLPGVPIISLRESLLVSRIYLGKFDHDLTGNSLTGIHS